MILSHKSTTAVDLKTCPASQLEEETSPEQSSLEVRSSPIAKFRRKRVFVRADHRFIFSEIRTLQEPWITRQAWETSEDNEGKSQLLFKSSSGSQNSHALANTQTQFWWASLKRLSRKVQIRYTLLSHIVYRCVPRVESAPLIGKGM